MSRCPRSNADAESDGQIVGGFSDIDCSGNLTIGSVAGGSGVLSRSELSVDKSDGVQSAASVGAQSCAPSDVNRRNWEKRQRRKLNKQDRKTEQLVEAHRNRIEARISADQIARTAAQLQLANDSNRDLKEVHAAKLTVQLDREDQLTEKVRELQKQQTAGHLQLGILRKALLDHPLAQDHELKAREIEQLKATLAERNKTIEDLTAKNLSLAVRVGSLKKAASSAPDSSRSLGSNLTESNIRDWIQQPPRSQQ